MRPNNSARFILWMFPLMLLLSGCGYVSETFWKPTELVHQITYSNLLEMIWVRPDVYIENWVGLGLASSDDRVYILGSTSIEESSSVNALDSVTSDLVWKTEPRPVSTLFADRGGVYVGEGGGGGIITKYDPSVGKVQWSRVFSNSSGTKNLVVYENQLHAYLAPDLYRVLRTSNGKTLFSLSLTQPPFFESRLCGNVYQTPVYTVDTIYYRTGLSLEAGHICALDISTGELRWKTELSVISNLVVGKDTVFVLVESGELIALNPMTGEKLPNLYVSFDNQPFILYNTRTEVGSYFVAYDHKNNILLAYLGDSRQLFAFQVP